MLTSADTWAITVQQAAPFGPAIDAPVGYTLRSAADTAYLGPYVSTGAALTSTVWPSSANDRLGHVFQLALGAGGAARLAYFLYRARAENAFGPEDCFFYGNCTGPATGALNCVNFGSSGS